MNAALQVSGCLHIVNNIVKGMVSHMPHYNERAWPLLNTASEALQWNYFRDRLKATCFSGDLEGLTYLFDNTVVTLIKWRFGSLASLLPQMSRLEHALKMGWDVAKMRFGDKGPMKAVNLDKVDEAFKSEFMWSWIRSIKALVAVCGHLEHWFEACPCHRFRRNDEDLHWEQSRAAFSRRLGLSEVASCPLQGMRAPELAAGDLDSFVDDLLHPAMAQVVVQQTAGCTQEERAWILEDFEAGRQHLLLMLRLHSEPWRRIP
eukprot:5149470-Heterocapsa_arctica.AAC.1